MYQEEVERFAFLYFCGSRDKDILAGRERMSFLDFERLLYITGLLGFVHLNFRIWKEFAPQFKEKLDVLERMYEEDKKDTGLRENEEEIWQSWLAEFCENAPDPEVRKYLEGI